MGWVTAAASASNPPPLMGEGMGGGDHRRPRHQQRSEEEGRRRSIKAPSAGFLRRPHLHPTPGTPALAGGRPGAPPSRGRGRGNAVAGEWLYGLHGHAICEYRRLRWRGIIAALCFFAILGSACPAMTAPPGGTVEGVARDAQRRPLPGVQLTLRTMTGRI